MKDQPFHFELQDLLIQFIAAFDDVTISRHDKTRTEREKIKVRYIHAPKERVIYDIVNKAQNITLPVISINVTSLARDESRVFNKIDGFYLPKKRSEDPKLTTHIGMPVPVNVAISMNILASYQSDLDQIISNFVPYSNPYVVISWKIPEDFGLTDITEIRSEVLWDGNIQYEYPIDIDASAKPRFIASTSFIIKGWLFPANREDVKNIYFIDANFRLTANALNLDMDYDALTAESCECLLSAYNLQPNVETVSISGIPSITNLYRSTDRGLVEIYNSTYTLSGSQQPANNLLIIGENLKWTTNIVLSSNNNTLYSNLTSFDFTYYDDISGFIVPPDNYQIVSDTTINLTLPPLTGVGGLNIILMDFVGYSTSDSISSRIIIV